MEENIFKSVLLYRNKLNRFLGVLLLENFINFMKKSLIFLIFLFAVGIIFSGCAKKQVNNQVSEFRRPDFGQPEGRADIMGLVKSVTGNEVTILKIDRPAEGEGRFNNNETKIDDEKKSSLGGSTDARMPGMGRGMRKPDADMQAQMLEKMKEMSSGEEKVLIPVGIRMLMPDTSSEDKTSVLEASLSDIKIDKMIQIWLDENSTDRKLADFVMIMK